MATCTKEKEIELSDGTTVEGTIEVDGFLDENFGADADGNRGEARWLVDGWSFTHEEELSDDQQAELDEEVERIVFEETWDFENAGERDEEPDLDE